MRICQGCTAPRSWSECPFAWQRSAGARSGSHQSDRYLGWPLCGTTAVQSGFYPVGGASLGEWLAG